MSLWVQVDAPDLKAVMSLMAVVNCLQSLTLWNCIRQFPFDNFHSGYPQEATFDFDDADSEEPGGKSTQATLDRSAMVSVFTVLMLRRADQSLMC